MKSAWEELAARYFRNNEDLRLLMVLMDIRRDPGREELMALDLARSTGARSLIVATKADKLTFSARGRRMKEIARLSTAEPIPVSAVSREGIDAVWECIVRDIPSGLP
jgi:GTP-binding protein